MQNTMDMQNVILTRFLIIVSDRSKRSAYEETESNFVCLSDETGGMHGP